MTSEGASAAVAAHAHNKFMTIGKKQRYIEVRDLSSLLVRKCLGFSQLLIYSILSQCKPSFLVKTKSVPSQVFQCSPDEMNLMVAAPPRPPPPMQPTPPSAAAPLILPPHPRIFPGQLVAQLHCFINYLPSSNHIDPLKQPFDESLKHLIWRRN